MWKKALETLDRNREWRVFRHVKTAGDVFAYLGGYSLLAAGVGAVISYVASLPWYIKLILGIVSTVLVLAAALLWKLLKASPVSNDESAPPIKGSKARWIISTIGMLAVIAAAVFISSKHPLFTPPALPVPRAIPAKGGQPPEAKLEAKPETQILQEHKRNPKVMVTKPVPPVQGDAAGQTAPSSISQSNSGGVNVQQATTGNNSPIINSPITVGDVPKSISPDDLAELTSFFLNAKAKGKVEIVADQISGISPFPNSFYQALYDGGWDMAQSGVASQIGVWGPGRRFQGAVLTIKGDPIGPGQTTKRFYDSDRSCISPKR